MINLCSANGPSAHPIEDADLCNILKTKVIREWPVVKNPENFPGPQPVSLEREYIWKLDKYPYSVCEKTDGMRFLLVVAKVGGEVVSAVVDRAFRFYRIELTSRIDGLSILDGELVCETKGDLGWTFYAYDAIVVGGTNCAKQPLDTRHEKVAEFVKNVLESSFDIKAKKFWKLCHLGQMLQDAERNPLKHNSDGLIFTPRMLPVGTATQMSLVKWKPSTNHTFDFKVHIKRGANNRTRYDLYSSDRGKIVKHCSINERTHSGRIFHEKYRSVTQKSVAIVECTWNIPGGYYEPVLERTDKTHPNSVRTIEKTHLNIRENITMDEIVSLSKDKRY